MTPRRIEDEFTELKDPIKRYRARRSKLGICSVHGCKSSVINKMHCDDHRLKHNKRMKEWMKKRKGGNNDSKVIEQG